MPIIYIDNFRGFKSTYLPLKEINFFVGENSTGKTSILKLIGIISSPSFWQYQQFGEKETSLGSFSEIITSTGKGKDYFEIGILGDEKEESKSIEAIKLKFIEKNNTPYLKELCIINDSISLQATIEGDLLKYRFSKVDLSKFGDLNKLEIFKKWLCNKDLDSLSFYKEDLMFKGISTILFQLQTSIGVKQNNTDGEKPVKLNIPSFLRDIAWLAPIRTEPRKTYDEYTAKFDPEGKHAPYTLKRLLKDSGTKAETRESAIYIINRFGKDSGLFDGIDINVLGEHDDSPFEIILTLNGRSQKITNVGYGVSQILPVIIEAISRPPHTWFAIQQPEVHLHPRAQAAFGDFIYKSNDLDKQRYIIETHSDYTIDRFRLRINKASGTGTKPKIGEISQVVFFSRHKGGNKLEIIDIQSDGNYPDEQPKEFREFFIREQLDLISI